MFSTKKKRETAELHERVVKAWESAPYGTKARVAVITGYTRQTLDDIITKGRKDESILLLVHQAIKQASADIAKDVMQQNTLVQKS